MLVFVFAIIFLCLIGFMVAGFMGAPWVPAYKRDVAAILDDATLHVGQTYIELGCGDARLVVAAAKRGANAIGYEINPVMCAIGWMRCWRYKNARVIWGDLWKADISQADVVMMFLMPKFMPRVERKLEAEMKAGSKVIAYVFKLPTNKPRLSRHHWFVYDY